MKKSIVFSALSLLLIGFFSGCEKDTYSHYPGGVVSEYISLFDIRTMHKGQDVTLTTQNMFGADKITGVVVSDHSGGNMPAGMLVMQDKRRLNQLRGIHIPIAEAADYLPGDSLIIDVKNAVLKKVDGVLQLTGIASKQITKVSSGNAIAIPIVKANSILAAPGNYEGTLVSIAKIGFDPSYPAGATYAGDRIINDGFGNMILHTETGAEFATLRLPYLSNITGIIFNTADNKPQIRPRKKQDIVVLSATAPKVANIVITGFLVNPPGTDKDYEYIQLLATANINFAQTKYSIVTTNNAGASTPTGYPASGWATGDLRTYKINLTSGTVAKGQYFYVGSNKKIWGGTSTDISSSIWFTKAYGSLTGDDFGSATTNLLANSGNGAGIAVFDTITVTETSIPVDVIFYGGEGQLYTAGPPAKGYRIANTDYYDIVNPSTLADQPFLGMGSNTTKLAFPTGENFAQLGGKYNRAGARWTQARTLNNVTLTNTSTVAAIEGTTTLE